MRSQSRFNQALRIWRQLRVLASVAIAFACLMSSANAAPIHQILESLARAAAPAKKLPDAKALFRHADDLPKLPAPANVLSDADAIKQFDRLQGANDSLRRDFLALPPAHRAAVLELGSAAQKVVRHHDDAFGLLRKLDLDGLAQARTYGDFVVDGVQLMDAPYKSVVRKMGGGAGVFFERYLRPNYKVLLTGGIVAAYLATPEKFHDEVGKLTSWAAERFAALGIDVAGAVPRGIWNALCDKFAQEPVWTTIGTTLSLLFLASLLPRVRWWMFRGLRFWFTTPVSSVTAPPKTPFKE